MDIKLTVHGYHIKHGELVAASDVKDIIEPLMREVDEQHKLILQLRDRLDALNTQLKREGNNE